MAPPADPYRTLGLTRGASIDEVRRAYRRLAKLHHPDTGGEAAVPRFLAIRAAYEQIVGPGKGSSGTARAGKPPPQPWSADPDRANATHRAYGGRSRRARPASGARSTPPPPPPPPRSDAAGDDPPTAESKKATLGSTSYDGADREPFDPDWGGASWYGTTSGTYWTINPKEYADPRKHGPEYQARARRLVADAEQDAIPEPTPSEPAPTATTESWWDATAGPVPNDASAAGDVAAPGGGAGESTGEPGDPAGRLGRFVLEVRRRVGRSPRP